PSERSVVVLGAAALADRPARGGWRPVGPLRLETPGGAAGRSSGDLAAFVGNHQRPGYARGCPLAGRQAAGLRGVTRRAIASLPSSSRPAGGPSHSRNRGRRDAVLLAGWAVAGLLHAVRLDDEEGPGRRGDASRRGPGGVSAGRELGGRRDHRLHTGSGV